MTKAAAVEFAAVIEFAALVEFADAVVIAFAIVSIPSAKMVFLSFDLFVFQWAMRLYKSLIKTLPAEIATPYTPSLVKINYQVTEDCLRTLSHAWLALRTA